MSMSRWRTSPSFLGSRTSATPTYVPKNGWRLAAPASIDAASVTTIRVPASPRRSVVPMDSVSRTLETALDRDDAIVLRAQLVPHDHAVVGQPPGRLFERVPAGRVDRETVD